MRDHGRRNGKGARVVPSPIVAAAAQNRLRDVHTRRRSTSGALVAWILGSRWSHTESRRRGPDTQSGLVGSSLNEPRRKTACLPLLAALTLMALLLAPTAEAKLTLHFNRATARSGDQVTLTFGVYFSKRCDKVHVYLVRASILNSVIETGVPRRPRLGPPAARLGVIKVATALSGSRGATFQVPKIPIGRYVAVLWCSTCSTKYLLASFPGSVPEDAFVRPDRRMIRIVR